MRSSIKVDTSAWVSHYHVLKIFIACSKRALFEANIDPYARWVNSDSRAKPKRIDNANGKVLNLPVDQNGL
jgi:hypothetical protein